VKSLQPEEDQMLPKERNKESAQQTLLHQAVLAALACAACGSKGMAGVAEDSLVSSVKREQLNNILTYRLGRRSMQRLMMRSGESMNLLKA
jgi:hypothetical protein